MSDSLARARLARAARSLKRRSASPLPALVLMSDDERLADPLAAARALPRGSMIVVRSRDSARLAGLACELLRIAHRRGLAVLIAGEPLLAARIGADGIHLSEVQTGQAAHWRARFPALTITASAHSLRGLMRAKSLGADAVFLSPVFPTGSHPGRAAMTPVRANFIARNARGPVYALGGIDSRNAVRLSGFCGIAAIGALST